ncbi:uncharacterized protein BJX67DRAFT_194172 [Aspergillus lucknowensis]|uniref:Uncharacterized protein n=1 Tax=Aspergillus lucknowensis TaxID=176173 RepID=A0ABR4LK17_9EURO
MPAPTESGSENRRPRRPSITQQFQRMFHTDKSGDASKSGSYENSSRTGFAASASHQSSHSIRSVVRDADSRGYVKYGQSTFSSNEYSRQSRSSLASKTTGLNTSESRTSSLQSFKLESQQLAKDVRLSDSPLHGRDVNVASTASHVVQKKDRRATKRLEAERLELEKRLFKLEEAERTGDMSVLRRESRRLTKKQPLGSSSRSSSVSGDESRSRPASRLSSIFSSSRRRSRSRSSSTDGIDSVQFARPESTSSHDYPNALPTLSSTLPERLSTAISKELAARKNALLASAEPSTQSLKLPGPSVEPNNMTTEQPAVRVQRNTPSLVDLTLDDVVRKDAHIEWENLDDKDDHKQADLDRALFTASLNSGKRRVAVSHMEQPSKPVGQIKSPNRVNGAGFSEISTEAEHENTGGSSKSSSHAAPLGGMPMSMLPRPTLDGVLPRSPKTFKSSPLAESHTVNGDNVQPTPKRATTLPTLRSLDSAGSAHTKRSSNMLQASSGNTPDREPTLDPLPRFTVKILPTETRIPRSSSNKIPTSKLSQSASSALLTKPRFYNSLSKVTAAPPGGGQPTTIARPSPLQQQREVSPSVPPKSPKRSSRALSRSPEPATVPDNRLQPTSSLSAGPSEESESDYNTAGEDASTMSVVSVERGPSASANTSAVDSAPSVSKKNFHATLDCASQRFKTEPREEVNRIKTSLRGQLVAKLFVICCRCKFWHDIPSEMYAVLTNSDPLSAALDQDLAWEHNALPDILAAPSTGTRALREPSPKRLSKSDIQRGLLRTRATTDRPPGPVRCCWCEHHMSKQCCQGWTTMVQMCQRHH